MEDNNKFYLAWITSLDMLEDRGYNIDKEKYFYTYEDFVNKMIANNINIYLKHKEDEKNTIYLEFLRSKKINQIVFLIKLMLLFQCPLLAQD